MRINSRLRAAKFVRGQVLRKRIKVHIVDRLQPGNNLFEGMTEREACIEAFLQGWNKGVASFENALDSLEEGEDVLDLAYELEEHQQSYSPFEHFAHDIDEVGEEFSRTLWDCYEEGVSQAITVLDRIESFKDDS